MNYTLNQAYGLRNEFFGGFLPSKNSSNKVICTHQDYIFIWILNQVGSLDLAKNLTKNILNETYMPDTEFLIENNIIINSNKILNRDITEITKKAKELLSNIPKKRNCLSAPLELTIYPTFNCQLNCSFCYVEKNKCLETDVVKWENLFAEAKMLGVQDITILGGEPTTYKYLPLLLYKLDDLNINSFMTTNGYYLPPSVIDAITTSNVSISFSLQSLDKLNVKLMGIDHKRIIKNILLLKSKGKKIRLNIVYSGQTYNQIVKIIDFCLQNDIDDISLSAYINTKNISSNNPSLNELKLIHEKIMLYIDSKNINESFSFLIEGCLLFSAYESLENPVKNEIDKFFYGCDAGKTKIEIFPDGSSIPCMAFNNSFKSGNVFDKGLKEVWTNDPWLEKLRNYKNKGLICNKCEYNNFCNGGCPASNYNLFNDYTKGDDLKCEIVRKTI